MMQTRQLAAIGCCAVLALCEVALGQEADEAPLPDLAAIRQSLDRTWRTVEQVAALIGELAWASTSNRAGEPQFTLTGAATTHFRWWPDHRWRQSTGCWLSAEPRDPPKNESISIVYEDFERRYVANVRRLDQNVVNNHVVSNTILEPSFEESWILMALGVAGDNYESLAALIGPDSTVVGRDDVDGLPCVVVDTGRRIYSLAVEFDYAPVLCVLTDTWPDGTISRTEIHWLGYAPAAGAEDVSVAHQYMVRSLAGTDGDRWTTNGLRLVSFASVQLNDAMAEPPWPLEVPLLAGALYRNELTGLPQGPQTFGYSVEQLRHHAYEAAKPFGVDVPELGRSTGVPAQPGEAR